MSSLPSETMLMRSKIVSIENLNLVLADFVELSEPAQTE